MAPLRRWLFEGRLGVYTSAVVPLEDLGVAGDEREFYAPAGWLTLNRILPRREVSDQDVFLDIGAGMGRVVLRAAQYPFRRVIGVELSDDLTAIARANVEHLRPRLRCQDVELCTADVLDYEIPDDVTVAFLNNPFRGAVFKRALDALVASLERRPRRLRVIYRAPREEAMLAALPHARKVRARGRHPDKRVVMYELAPG